MVRNTLNSVVVIVPESGSRRMGNTGGLTGIPCRAAVSDGSRSCPRPRVPLKTSAAVMRFRFLKATLPSAPSTPRPLVLLALYTKMMGSAPTSMVFHFQVAEPGATGGESREDAVDFEFGVFRTDVADRGGEGGLDGGKNG